MTQILLFPVEMLLGWGSPPPEGHRQQKKTTTASASLAAIGISHSGADFKRQIQINTCKLDFFKLFLMLCSNFDTLYTVASPRPKNEYSTRKHHLVHKHGTSVQRGFILGNITCKQATVLSEERATARRQLNLWQRDCRGSNFGLCAKSN